MAIIVNGEVIPELIIREERDRVSRDLRWASISNPAERTQRIQDAAEYSAVNRVVFEQAIARDCRPVDYQVVEQEVARQKLAGGCRTAYDDQSLRSWIELQLRRKRLTAELTAHSKAPSFHEVVAFYDANKLNFERPERFHAAHIVCNITPTRSEGSARAEIELALAELERGDDFAIVVERHSDCKDNGGDIGLFPAGEMVPEFEAAIRTLQVGERTSIFKTSFGFHIAELRGKKVGGSASFDEVRQDIERVLSAINEQREFLRGLALLRERADIRRIPDVNRHNGDNSFGQ
jgi:parvulin-like peptidyl-prolyl isomerase